MSQDPIVIVAAKRTPVGAFQSALKNVKATTLGSTAIKGALDSISLSPETIDDVIMGCVLPAGLGQAPARQACINAGLPNSTRCVTINKVCGSGMKALMCGFNQLLLNQSDVVVAGGMESMTNAPYLLLKGRGGYRFGNDQIFDHMMLDGLEDAYDGGGRSMGMFGEDTAQKYGFSRKAQDAYAIETGKRALNAVEKGYFQDEIVPVTFKARGKEVVINQDEPPTKVNFEKIPTLRPAFRKDGTLTAATSSSLTDGAAALILMRQSDAEKQGVTPLAIFHGHASHSQEPEWFTTAPIGAIKKLSQSLNWPLEEVDLFEINEAFAVVTMAAMKDLGLPQEKVNVNGGACALGHPIGATGARLVVTLIHALKQRSLKKGIASLCIGGGEGTAVGIEVL
ncbi:MAG: acetyl-CoA C-acyltransferase [Pseudomonadota bacterium]